MGNSFYNWRLISPVHPDVMYFIPPRVHSEVSRDARRRVGGGRAGPEFQCGACPAPTFRLAGLLAVLSPAVRSTVRR